MEKLRQVLMAGRKRGEESRREGAPGTREGGGVGGVPVD